MVTNPACGLEDEPMLIICFAGEIVPPVAAPLHDVPVGSLKVSTLAFATVDAVLFRL